MFLIFNNIDEFNTWHSQVNQILGYPSSAEKTQQYTDPLPAQNDKIICTIDQNCPPQLLEGKTLYNYDDIKDFLLCSGFRF